MAMSRTIFGASRVTHPAGLENKSPCDNNFDSKAAIENAKEDFKDSEQKDFELCAIIRIIKINATATSLDRLFQEKIVQLVQLTELIRC